MKTQTFTRKAILSIVSSVYDPIGFLAPFTFTAKYILQELSKLNCGWDDRISNAYHLKWQQWLIGLQQMESYRIDKCIKPKGFGEIASAQLHNFCDASEIGYGVVTYLRLTNAENVVHTAFLFGKARVAPLKKMTLLRLELTAAMLAVKVEKMLNTELQIPLMKSVFWSDSTSVLKSITNDTKRFQTFVANRIGVIRELTNINQWRHINTKANPADYASRGMTAEVFLKHDVWISGPQFLSGTEEEWPHSLGDLGPVSHDDPEIKREKVTVNVIQTTEPNAINILIHFFSTWTKLQRTVAWLLRLKIFLEHLRNKRKEVTANIQDKEKDQVKQEEMIEREMKAFKSSMGVQKLALEDLKSSETAIVQCCQAYSFQEEVVILQSESKSIKRQSSIFKLDPRLDQGLLRVGGRLSKMAMAEETKHPAILPKNHHVSRLILEHIHRQIGHSGRNHMLLVLQQKYWILCANALSRKVINDCVICRQLRGNVGEQKMAGLPTERITPDLPPFTKVGVDYFGPIEVKRGRNTVKRYRVIFTFGQPCSTFGSGSFA